MTLTGTQPTTTQVQATEALTLLDGLYMLMRATASLGPGHASLTTTAEEVAAGIQLSALPCSLQFLGAAAYCNRVLLPVDIDRVAQVVLVARSLDQLGAQELVFEHPPSAQLLLDLALLLARGSQATPEQREALTGVSFRPLVGPASIRSSTTGEPPKPVDRDVAARVWLTRAVLAADRLDRHEEAPWPWAMSAAIVKRLEQIQHLDPDVALRALELTAQPWTPGRRAVAAALRTLAMLDHAKVSAETQRMATHLALILGIHSFGQQDARSFDASAQAALQRIGRDPGVDAVVSARHRLQVQALLDALARRAGTGGAWPGPLSAVLVAWKVEALRGGDGDSPPRTLLDALSAADTDSYLPGGRAWLRVLVSALGGFPPGSAVLDANRQLGAVLDSGLRARAERITLMTKGQLVQGQPPLMPLFRDV